MNQALRIKRAVEKARMEFIRQTERHINTILSNYELALNDITRELSNIDTAIDSFSTQRLLELQNHITQRISQIKTTRDKQVVDALNDAGKSGFDTQMLQREIMGRAPLGVSWFIFLPRGVEQYQSFALQLCDQYDQELVNAIQQRLRLGFMERKSWSELITDIRQNAFGFKKYQRIDRKDKGASWKIKRMVRTEMQRMRTMAEEEVVRQDQDVIGVYFYFGGGPCDGSCERLVGEYYKDGSGKGWPPPSIPLHPNCTCFTSNIYPDIKHYIRSLAKQETGKEVPAYIREVNDLIAKGINTPDDAIRLGGVLRKEVNSRLDDKLLRKLDDLIQKEKTIEEAYKGILAEYEKAINKYQQTQISLLSKKVNEIEEELKSIRKKVAEAQKNFQTKRADIIKQVIKEIRDTGEGVLLKFDVTSESQAEMLVREVFDFLPREWAEASAQTPLHVIVRSERGYYRDAIGSVPAKIVINRGDKQRCVIHEVGHRIESTNPIILKLEKEFYEERTRGNQPVTIPGYSAKEKYIPNDWADPYVGKYYERGAYEILSMGLEGIFAPKPYVDIWKDLKHVDFILGLLGGV